MSQPTDLKIPLERRKRSAGSGHVYHHAVTRILPLYYTPRGTRVHRIRRAEVIERHWFRDPKRADTDIAVDFWCGNTGSTSRGFIVAASPSGWPLCGTCEGRAVGAGYPGIAILQQRYELLYSPREGRAPAAAREAAG